MSDASKPYEISDAKTFDQNIDAYETALVAIDPVLGSALKLQVKDLIAKKISPTEIWDALLAAAEQAEQQTTPVDEKTEE